MTNRSEDGRNSLELRAQPSKTGGPVRLLGSLRDALLAASREPADSEPETDAREVEVGEPTVRYRQQLPAPQAHAGERGAASPSASVAVNPVSPVSADRSAADARPPAGAELPPAVSLPVSRTLHPPAVATPRVPVDLAKLEAEASTQAPRTQPVVRGHGDRARGDARTQLLRGRQKVSRAKFHQDPVVGWLVVVGGPGLGAHRSIYEGNNTVGRALSQRIPVDFGDDTISNEEQAYIRYDSSDRSFLFVPNLAKTNVVQVNDAKPTGAVTLQPMDVITMGRTQLVFVPFCGAEFDWAELSDVKE